MIEIVLDKPDNFLILKETLTRIGLPNKEGTKLYQTCHILCKRKRYFVVHFKELFILDGRTSNLNPTDVARRNSIINYLRDRKFFKLVGEDKPLEPSLPRNGKDDDFTIIQHEDKTNWELVPKYVIGNPANRRKKPPVLRKVMTAGLTEAA
jgi:hypothetical protein